MTGGTNGQHRANIPPSVVTRRAVEKALQTIGLAGVTVHQVDITKDRIRVLWRPDSLPYQGSMAPLRRSVVRVVERLPE